MFSNIVQYVIGMQKCSYCSLELCPYEGDNSCKRVRSGYFGRKVAEQDRLLLHVSSLFVRIQLLESEGGREGERERGREGGR